MTECSSELSLSTCPASAFTPSESRNASANTIVEWPRENQNPTDSGVRISLRGTPAASFSALSAISFRVVLSTAAMWSASNACRNPNVYARMPTPMENTGWSPPSS